MFEPLKITAYPRCGIESDQHLPIDAILYYAAMARHYGPQALSTPGQATAEPVDLPLAKHAGGGVWFYSASFAQWDSPSEGQTFWAKRFDRKQEGLIDFGKKRGKVITEQGQYKAYKMPVFYRHALSVSWYVVGDKDAIESLLATMTHVGKKTSQGFGRINRWTVESIADDWSLYKDGQLMRAMPQSGGILYGIRPSYWESCNQVPCLLP